MNRIINMIINKLFRRSMRAGVAKSIAHVAGKSKPSVQGGPLAKSQANAARETAKRARQAARVTRRLGR